MARALFTRFSYSLFPSRLETQRRSRSHHTRRMREIVQNAAAPRSSTSPHAGRNTLSIRSLTGSASAFARQCRFCLHISSAARRRLSEEADWYSAHGPQPRPSSSSVRKLRRLCEASTSCRRRRCGKSAATDAAALKGNREIYCIQYFFSTGPSPRLPLLGHRQRYDACVAVGPTAAV